MEIQQQQPDGRTITARSIKVSKAWKHAEFLDGWAAELRESGDCDMLREAIRLENDARSIRASINNDGFEHTAVTRALDEIDHFSVGLQ